jgi:flagellar hook assembly protein FlgD
MLTGKCDPMKRTTVSTAAALLLLAATAASQDIQMHTFSFNTDFSVSSVSNTQLRGTVGEAVVGITKGSMFAVGSGFLVDFGVIEHSTLPRAYTLMQNYPNPFNSTTTIRYDLPKSANVSLKIYNILGQLVATLVDGRKEAGHYQITWNANSASGIYFYRLYAEQFVQTKKMILLK